MNNTSTGCAVRDMSHYREDVLSECTGPLHNLLLKWNIRGGRVIQGEEPVAAAVCERHLSDFRKLGERDDYNFIIISDELVESPIAGEKEK